MILLFFLQILITMFGCYISGHSKITHLLMSPFWLCLFSFCIHSNCYRSHLLILKLSEPQQKVLMEFNYPFFRYCQHNIYSFFSLRVLFIIYRFSDYAPSESYANKDQPGFRTPLTDFQIFIPPPKPNPPFVFFFLLAFIVHFILIFFCQHVLPQDYPPL